MTPPAPTPQWYDLPPELYSGTAVVNFYSSTPSVADIVDLGGGDYSLDVSGFVAGDSLLIDIPGSSNIQIVFSGPSLAESGVAVSIDGSVETVGPSISSVSGTIVVGGGDIYGACAIIIEGKLYARIALHTSSFSVDDCFALPLPLFAYREEEAVKPISIEIFIAGWQIYSPYSPTRIVGYNLPTNLEYTADGESVARDLTADGGDYGIEFTTPDRATKIAIFDEEFWLYLDSRR